MRTRSSSASARRASWFDEVPLGVFNPRGILSEGWGEDWGGGIGPLPRLAPKGAGGGASASMAARSGLSGGDGIGSGPASTVPLGGRNLPPELQGRY